MNLVHGDHTASLTTKGHTTAGEFESDYDGTP